MLAKPSTCQNCILENANGGFSLPEGRCKTGVLIVGEALGDREKFDGLPFRPYAEAGSALMTAIRLALFKREDFAYWNMIGCQPPYNNLENTTYEYQAIDHCKIHFKQVLERYKPKAILALGNVPLKHLRIEKQETLDYIQKLELSDPKKLKNYLKKFKISSLRGYIFDSIYGIPMIASLHPSFVTGEGRIYIGVLKRDLETAVNLAQGNIPKFKSNYITNPTIEQARKFYLDCKNNPTFAISHDIETPETVLTLDESEIEYENVEVRDIDSIQFSIREGESIFFPWYGEFIELTKLILALPNPKTGWNSRKFDKVNIEYHLGQGAIKGLNIDAMDAWKWLNQDFVKMGRALQFATNFFAPNFPAWKHLAQIDEKLYGCLHSESRIVLADGTNKKIRDIVKNKLALSVRTLDDDGNIINANIIGWRKIVNHKQRWIKIETFATRQPIFLTPDHEVWIDNKWKRADEVKYGDKIIIPRLGHSDLLHGTLLGDGSVDDRGRFTFSHCLAQTEWFEAKRKAVNGPKYIVPSKIRYIKKQKPFMGNVFLRTEFWTDRLVWRNKFYDKNGFKRFIPPTDKALAIWYGDDGTLASYSQPRIQIYNSFSNFEDVLIWFRNKFGKENVVYYKDKRSPNGGCIALNGTAKKTFFECIDKFLHPSMDYKLPIEHKNKYNNWMKTEKQAQFALVANVTRHSPDREQNNRYCITIDHPTHRFFTLGGLVKNCFDPDAALRIFNDLQRELSSRRLFPDTKSLWQGFIDDVVKLRPILDDMTARGFPIDPIKREEFRQQIHSERELTLNQLQDIYPMNLRKVTPAEGYKFVPKEVSEVDLLFEKASNVHNKGLFYIVEDLETVELRKAQYLEEHTRRVEDDEEEKLKTTGLLLKEFLIEGNKEMRYCRMEQFKPNSRNQVLDYIKFKKYKVPKKRDRQTGEEKETTSKDELYHIAEEHPEDPFLKLVVLYRELDHLESTYVGKKSTTKSGKVKLTGWQPNAENRINAEFLTKPATGQLSTNPNIQNAPARGTFFSSPGYAKLAQQFRQIVVAEKGKVLLSADWSAFHALTQSVESVDPEYMRVVKIDPHSFVAAHILSTDIQVISNKLKNKKPDSLTQEEWKAKILIQEETIERFKDLHSWLALPDVKLAENLKFIKTNYKMIRDSQAKPALLGMGFGMGVRKFYKLNRHTFKSEAEPKRILDLIRKLFPKTFVNFHTNIKDLADKQTYLISRYGYIRRFYNVYDWRMQTKPRTIKPGEQQIKNSRGEWWIRKDGTDAEAAIAYLPANHAFGIKKEKMRDLWEYEEDGIIKNKVQEYGLINEIHDDLLWEIDEDKLEEASLIIKSVMERPAKYIRTPLVPQGLVCRVSMESGKNWAKHHPINNPNGMKELNI